MVVDSSVLIAILLNEPEVESYRRRLADAQDIYISAVSIVESSMVIEYKGGELGAKKYDELLKIIAPTIIAFDEQQAKLARIAWQEYGKGRHPAKLNFGDCCSYALAKYMNQPLLFKGDDFSKTDLLLA
ncbi:MAG: type II toxin-antitoxin system VapC family toxin [Methylococcaceae bacterium]|nr:type II toxin-antitoxin system VapC family toxin [Methylococcaceae bacterium]